MSYQTVCSWEYDAKHPNDANLIRLGVFFDMNPNDIRFVKVNARANRYDAKPTPPKDSVNPIRAHRKAKGLSVVALSDLLGVSRQTVYNWETGMTVPQAVALVKLCHLLDASPEQLIDVR